MIIHGHCLRKIDKLEPNSIQSVVTSPPYWALRDYDEAGVCWEDGWTGCLGDEDTPEKFVSHLVEIFDKMKTCLRDDGTMWINIGDTYFGAKGGHWDSKNSLTNNQTGSEYRMSRKAPPKHEYLKVKDLVGIPWKFAFKMQRKGWYLRQDIIWHKPNPMPEAVTDRCAKSHEHIFLFSKKKNYKFYPEAIKHRRYIDADQSHRKDVWSINTSSFKGSHFAVFPEKLPQLCILASSDEGDIILDPFAGSGTTGLVASKLDRKYILIELNTKYLNIIKERLNTNQIGLFGG